MVKGVDLWPRHVERAVDGVGIAEIIIQRKKVHVVHCNVVTVSSGQKKADVQE